MSSKMMDELLSGSKYSSSTARAASINSQIQRAHLASLARSSQRSMENLRGSDAYMRAFMGAEHYEAAFGGGFRRGIPTSEKVYWGPSTDLGSKLPPIPEGNWMRNLGKLAKGLGYAGMVLQAYDLYQSWSRYGAPQYDVPSPWYRCATPDWAASFSCNGGQEPAPELWDWQGTGAFLSNCANAPWGQCPQAQFSAYNDPLGTTSGWPTDVTSVVFSRVTPGLPGRYDLLRNYRRPSVAGQTTPWPSYSGRAVLPTPQRLAESEHDPGVENKREESFFPLGDAVVRPATNISVGGSGPPRGGPGTHVLKPNGDNKVRMPYSMALKLYHALTEVGDATDCLFQALSPKGKGHLSGVSDGGRYGQVSYRPVYNRMTQVQRARQVAENLGEIDWAKAAKCLIGNEIEDRLIGAGFGALDKYVTKRGGPSTTQLTGYMKNIPRASRGPRQRNLGDRFGQVR